MSFKQELDQEGQSIQNWCGPNRGYWSRSGGLSSSPNTSLISHFPKEEKKKKTKIKNKKKQNKIVFR